MYNRTRGETLKQLRSAAAVVLTRKQPHLEVFWVRRSLQLAFQGGFYAFPGGQLDPNEDDRICAARELLEETGVHVDPVSLTDIGRWVTPAFAPRRFDTRFFMTDCPAGEHARVITAENDIGEWIRPADALAKWNEGQILAANPVTHTLKCLAENRPLPWEHEESPTEIEMRPRIVLVPVRTPTLPPATHTNCYVIGGDEVIVIDPASPYEEEQAVLDRALEKKKIREVWLTHLHRDHVGGANHLKQKRGVKIAAHPITKRDLQGFIEVDRTFEENELLELAGKPGWSLRVLHTPGHARGHVCIFEEKNGSLITGDLMAGLGTVVIDPPEGHMATYLDSLRRMLALDVTALFPAHGPVMANAKGKIREYIDHRLMRERNILKAWEGGARDTSTIVKQVYTDVAPEMWSLAERSITAHLEKLREEGRI
jgi:glyoxylase-like metal-dependent hydrolase (beta-lactamase superfamily II)/8-oxo-dGTP pyrophosphatase MutT (NUDIX family)